MCKIIQSIQHIFPELVKVTDPDMPFALTSYDVRNTSIEITIASGPNQTEIFYIFWFDAEAGYLSWYSNVENVEDILAKCQYVLSVAL